MPRLAAAALIGLAFLAGLVLAWAAWAGGTVGAKVSYSLNVLHEDAEEPLIFDTIDFETGGDFFQEGTPDRLVVAQTGCYLVEAQITILGSMYGPDSLPTVGGNRNPSATNFLISITRNGDPHDLVAATRLTNQNPQVAHLNDATSVECFEQGDYIQLFVAPDNRLIESNWPDSGGNLSPVLFLVLLD